MNMRWKLRRTMNNTVSSIGIIGYGRFGSFFADQVLPVVFPNAEIRISSQSHQDKRVMSFKHVVSSDLIIPAVPIRSLPEVLSKIADHIHQESIVMDVCSVNVFPARLMKEFLPKHTSIISTHPMFGSSSYEKVEHDLSKLTIVMYPLQINKMNYDPIYEAFKTILKVIEMSPEAHDRKTAQFQFLSHLLGGVLHQLDIKRSLIDTESASRMFDMMEVLNNDSMELFEDIYHYNPYAQEEFKKFNNAYKSVTNHLKS